MRHPLYTLDFGCNGCVNNNSSGFKSAAALLSFLVTGRHGHGHVTTNSSSGSLLVLLSTLLYKGNGYINNSSGCDSCRHSRPCALGATATSPTTVAVLTAGAAFLSQRPRHQGIAVDVPQPRHPQ
jgi:hypothetical protein